MPNWILKIAVSWGFSWAVSCLAARLRKDKAAQGALLKYRAGGTFLEIARSYAARTPEMTDDQIIEGIEQFKRDLTVVPFNKLVLENKILIMIGQTRIPDFDNDSTNDKEVGSLLGEIVNRTLGIESEEGD